MPIQPKRVVPPSGQSWPLTWLCYSDVFIGLFQPGEVTDDLWQGFMADLTSQRVARVLGCNVGSISVTSVQRRDLFDAVRGKKVTAVLDSRIAIGIATALRWLGLEFKTFAWDQLSEALQDLQHGNTEISIEDSIKLIEEFMVSSNVPDPKKLLKR